MAANYYKYSANMNDRTYFTSVVTTTSGAAKRYFSNVESEIYFGDKEMTDLYQFEFGIDEKVLPIYGYNCYYATEIVNGQRIVQGQFVVNYTDTKLIQNTLSSIDDSIYNQVYNEDYVPGGDLHHAIYDKAFDIMIGYGYYDIKDKQTYNATCQTIIGAKISGMHKVLDTTGQPILEVYSFIAKDFIEENITEASTNNGTDNTNTNNNNNNNNNSLTSSYKCSDEYNTNEITKNNTYVNDHNGCEHFIYNLTYTQEMITLNVRSNNKNNLTLTSASIEITDKLSNNITIPVFDFDISKSSGTVKLESKYSSLIKKCKQNNIKCVLKFQATVSTKNGTKNKYDVVHENACIHI